MRVPKLDVAGSNPVSRSMFSMSGPDIYVTIWGEPGRGRLTLPFTKRFSTKSLYP